MKSRTRSEVETLVDFLLGRSSDDVDWFELFQSANENTVTPWLLRMPGEVSDRVVGEPEARAYLELISDRNRSRNRQLWAQAVDAARLLNSIGIEPLFIKGVSRLARHSDPGDSGRVLCDVDLVVNREDRARAKALMEADGYQDIEGPEGPHTIGNYWKKGFAGQIDLHWRLPGPIDGILPYGDVLAASEARAVDGARFRLPDIQSSQILNIVHEFLHDRALRRGTLDLRSILELYEDRHAWTKVNEGAKAVKALKNKKFALSLELQVRMMRHLFGHHGPEVDLTALGTFLHHRRLFKLRNPRVHEVEKVFLRLLPRKLRLTAQSS